MTRSTLLACPLSVAISGAAGCGGRPGEEAPAPEPVDGQAAGVSLDTGPSPTSIRGGAPVSTAPRLRVVWTRDVGDGTDFFSLGVLPERRVRAADAASVASTDAGESRVVVEVRARHDRALPTPASIAPYREGLVALEYDVLDVVEGRLDHPVIAIAYWIIRDGRTVIDAARPAGQALRLELSPYEARQELEGKRLVMETTDLTLPLFYDVASADLLP